MTWDLIHFCIKYFRNRESLDSFPGHSVGIYDVRSSGATCFCPICADRNLSFIITLMIQLFHSDTIDAL